MATLDCSDLARSAWRPSNRPRVAALACAAPVFAALVWAGIAFAASTSPAVTPGPTPTNVPFEATSRHSFADVEHWKAVFDDPKRDAWQRPAEVVAALALRVGGTVADLGSGTGYFLPYLARAVGTDGTVLAVETEPNLLVHLRERAEHEGLANVVPVLASFSDSRLPARTVDLVLVVDTFHHIDGRLAYFERLARALTPDGRVAIVDWQAGELPVGPPPEHRIARDQVVHEMTEAGYALVAEPDILAYQYLLVFRRR